MTQDQQIRAWALAIAVLNNQGGFFKVLGGEHPIIEFNDRQKEYLKAIREYIREDIERPVSDSGWPELETHIKSR